VCGAVRELVGGVVERPAWRPVTRFEQRGLADGRTPVDLVYTVTR
jgi:tRNA (guanine-N7-)-methyltransferase